MADKGSDNEYMCCWRCWPYVGASLGKSADLRLTTNKLSILGDGRVRARAREAKLAYIDTISITILPISEAAIRRLPSTNRRRGIGHDENGSI